MPVGPATGLGREVARQLADLVEPGEVLAAGRVDEPLVEDHVDEREQQQRVGAGADEEVLVGLLGGAGAPRVDDDDLAAAGADRPQPAAHVGRGHQRAVGRQRVGAEHQQVVGAVEVGDRELVPGAEHQRRRPSASGTGRRSTP